jgi:hypothetical protein
MNLRKIYKTAPGNFCFYCNVDSDELKAFLIIVIGGLVLASIFVAVGAWLKGYFKNIEDPELKGKVLKLEETENGK